MARLLRPFGRGLLGAAFWARPFGEEIAGDFSRLNELADAPFTPSWWLSCQAGF